MKNNVKFLVIHHSVSLPSTTPKQINAWHQARGFPKSSLGWHIGYHYVIGDFYIKQTRTWDEVGAHCHARGMNSKSLGICLTGDFTQINEPNEFQKKELVKLLVGLMAEFKLKETKILLHRDVSATACPGKISVENLKSWIKKYHKRIGTESKITGKG